MGAQWLSGRVLDSRPRGRGFEPHRRHCVVSLSKNINPSLVLVQPRKTRPFITERLLMGRKELNQTNKQKNVVSHKVTGLVTYDLLQESCINRNDLYSTENAVRVLSFSPFHVTYSGP